jgi:hypothetical protein
MPWYSWAAPATPLRGAPGGFAAAAPGGPGEAVAHRCAGYAAVALPLTPQAQQRGASQPGPRRASRSRVAQSAERPAVNRQVIGSSPIAGASRTGPVSPLTCENAGRESGGTPVAPADFKIPTKSPQPARGRASRPAGRVADVHRPPARFLVGGAGCAATRGGGEVIELEHGITVYPAREGNGRWRAVWYEDGERQQCQAATEEKLAAKLEKVKVRLEAGAPNMKRPGADLVAHYLDPDRLPVDQRWSRKHAHTQRRLCERFAAPVINAVTCQDLTTDHAAPACGWGLVLMCGPAGSWPAGMWLDRSAPGCLIDACPPRPA